MGLGDLLGDYYHLAEDKFYEVADFLADKGVPVYAAIDPFEERGIPALPVFVLGIIALALLGFGFFFLQNQAEPISLSITDELGSSVKSVKFKLVEEKTGKDIELDSSLFSDRGTLTVQRPMGTKISLYATKEGYEPASKVIQIGKDREISLRLSKIENKVEGKLRLVDESTKDPIEGAQVVAKFSDSANIECIEESQGIYNCPNAVEGKDISLVITHPNYEQKNYPVKFSAQSESEVELFAKPGAKSGKTNLILRIFDLDSKQRLGGFSVRLYDAKTNDLITETEKSENDTEFVEKISKGTSVRIVVEKKDFLTYDSSVLKDNQTLRSDEVVKEISLRKGTNALVITVLDPTGRPVADVDVSLHNANSELVGEVKTSLIGEALFENLDVTGEYFVSVWQDKYVPISKKISLSQKNRENLVLERATASNSGTLNIFTSDEKGKPLNDVTLNFYRVIETNATMPLGVPAQKSDITGRYQLLAPINTTVLVDAVKGNLTGQISVKVLETFQNEALIQLREPFLLVNVKVLNDSGSQAKNGIISIVAGNDVLYEGSYETGGINVQPKGAKYITVNYTPEDDSEGFEEEVFVEGQDKVEVKRGGSLGVGTTPSVEFLGITNVDGTPAAGLAKGQDYFLKLRAVFPQGKNKNGLHVRIGDDTAGFVDSEDAGIAGFSASGASSFFGRSYSPQPMPGFEALDFENSGKEGSYSKWLELYFASGGEKIIKVRVKAKETARAGETTIRYRAWSEIANKTYRNPSDDELGLEKYSDTKTSLYAKTLETKLKILEQSASCKNDLCASYRFVRKDGSEFSPDNFRASLTELYALEITLSPDKRSDVTVKASTQKQKPKIFFQGFGINEDTQFPDLNLTDTSLQIENVPVLQSEPVKALVYFKPADVGSSFITLQLISGTTVINEQFYFDVFKEKNILVKTIPGSVVFGEDFIITLQDEKGEGVEKAQIIISTLPGEHLRTISGSNSTNRGLSGRYLVKNSFSQGEIAYEARVDGYKSTQGTIAISKENVLTFADLENYIVIQKGQNTAQKPGQLRNESRGLDIEGITYEVVPIGPLPEGLVIKTTGTGNLPKDSGQNILFVADYSGERPNAHGEAEIIARGKTQSGFGVVAKTKVIVDYAPTIPSECLEFSKQKISIYLASGSEDRDYYDKRYGDLTPTEPTSYYRYRDFTATTTENFTAKLAQKSQCQVQLSLKPEIVRDGKRSEGIEVESEEIKLQPQLAQTQGKSLDSDEITVSFTNKLIRNFPTKEKFNFNIVYKMDGFEKTLPVEVFIWNPRYALQVSRNIELFLGPDDQGRYAAQVPLFVRNVGEADIENVDFRVSSQSAGSGGNVNVTILPPYPVQFLKKGMSIEPPKLLVAQVLRNERTTLVEQKVLDITGVINGQTFSFGPVLLTAHVSASQCLVAIPGNVTFYSAIAHEGTLSEDVRLRNTCAEEVNVLDMTQPIIADNVLYMAPSNIVILPGSEVTVKLLLDKRSPYNGAAQQIVFRGVLPRSGAPIESTPVVVDIKLGEVASKNEAASELIEIPVCENPKEVKSIRFPLIATGSTPQCDSAYCDAVQLSNYLAERIEQKVGDAEKQITSKGAEVRNAFCSPVDVSRGFCTYSSLNIKPETFIVYFSHDSMTPQMLTKALDQKKGSARNFQARYQEGVEESGLYLGGFSRQALLNGEFKGCGMYTVSIKGSVAVQGSRIIPELMNILVDIKGEENQAAGQSTLQCVPKVQNAMNFLPKDDGLTKSSNYEAWIGVVNSRDISLDELSKDVAKKFFGSEQRAVQSDSGTNNLKLDLTNEDGYLVKVKMENISPNAPASITAYIRESLDKDEKLQKEIAKEASQVLADLRENHIEGCIGQDESYALLKSKKALGEISAKAGSYVPVQFKQIACTDFNIASQVRETIVLNAKKATNFDGIDDPFFMTKKFENISQETKIREIAADKLDDAGEKPTNKYTAQARICTIGNSQIQQSQGKKIVAEISRKSGQSKKPTPYEISLQVCGIHPLTFIEKTNSKDIADSRPGEYYYATFVWKGDPEKILINDLGKIGRANDIVNKSNEILDGKREIAKGDSEELKAAKRDAGTAFLGACAGTSVVTGILRPVIGWNPWTLIINVLGDCGIPYTALMSDAGYEWAKTITNIAGVVWNGIKALFTTPLKWIFGASGNGDVLDKAEKEIKPLTTGEAAATIYKAFALDVLIKDTFQAASRVTSTKKYETSNLRIKELSKSRVVAENVGDEIVKKLHAEAFGGIDLSTNPQAKTFLEDFRAKFLENVDAEVKLQGIAKGEFRGGVFTDDELKAAIQKAAQKTGQDPDVLKNLVLARKFINTTTPNTFIDKDAVTKSILDDVENLPKDIPTDDAIGGPKVRDATVATDKAVLEADTIAKLKDDMIEQYAKKMGITNAQARALIGTELDSIKLNARVELGSEASRTEQTIADAVTDKVTKNATSDVTRGMTEDLVRDAKLDVTEATKISGEFSEEVTRKVSEKMVNFSAIDPVEIHPQTIAGIKEETLKAIATKQGVDLPSAKLLFETRVDAALSLAPPGPEGARAAMVDYYAKLYSIPVADAEALLGPRIADVYSSNLNSVLGKKWGNIRGSVEDEIEFLKSDLTEKLKATGKYTEDQAKNLSQTLVDKYKKQVADKTATTISEAVTSETGARNARNIFTTEHYNKLTIPKNAQDDALRRMRDKLAGITKNAIDNAVPGDPIYKTITKAYQKNGITQITSAVNGKIDPKEGVPKLLSKKGGLLFMKNLLKEGAFGLLANYVGLVAYDNVLDRRVKNLNISPTDKDKENEIIAAGLQFNDRVFIEEAGAQNFIHKYRTYRIAVKYLQDGRKEIRMGLVEQIPENTKQELILNNCDDPGFNREIGGVLPGLLPVVDNEAKFPKFFQKSEAMKTLHVKIARNYLAPQQNGQRYGTLINAGVKDYKDQFRTQTGMNLEALVVSIGIVKSKLGEDPTTKGSYMFGCSLGVAAREDIYNNARCTSEKLVSYVPKCTAAAQKASCFLNEFSNDQNPPKNLHSNASGMSMPDEDFQDLYGTWASANYVWQTS